jgi:integrase
MDQITVFDRNESYLLQQTIRSIELDDSLQPSTKTTYISALQKYCNSGGSLANASQIREYAAGLAVSERAFLKAGISRMAKEIEYQVKSGATPENIDLVQANIFRAEALTSSIAVTQPKGEKVHTWLTSHELKALIAITHKNKHGLIGTRDRVALGLMSNGMLRRSEVVLLHFSDLKVRDGYHIIEVVGKGAKTRGVKLSPILAEDIYSLRAHWGDGAILRPLLKRKKRPKGYERIGDLWVGESMSSQALYNLVIKYGKMIGKHLQPHDLRRTGARVAWKAGVPIEQISLALGHESIETTSLYLGIERDWEKQPADFIPY